MIQAFTIAVLICLSYSIVAINTIAISRRKKLATAISGGLWMIVNFFVIKHIAEANSALEFLGYLIGGMLGDYLGICFTEKFQL